LPAGTSEKAEILLRGGSVWDWNTECTRPKGAALVFSNLEFYKKPNCTSYNYLFTTYLCTISFFMKYAIRGGQSGIGADFF
jgi:hypothetical protein